MLLICGVAFIAEYGPVMLVATHVDATRAAKTQHGEWISPDAQKTLETARKLVPHSPNFSSTVLIIDCNVPASYPFKQLKSTLLGLKQDCVQVKNTAPLSPKVQTDLYCRKQLELRQAFWTRPYPGWSPCAKTTNNFPWCTKRPSRTCWGPTWTP